MKRTTATVGVCLVAWGGLIATGFAAWECYTARPGPDGPPPGNRPASGFDREVVMFVHPHCPCSRAGLTELEEVMRGAGAGVCVRVVFVLPPGTPEGWERGALWNQAKELSGVRVSCDVAGVEARRAGATTAGHVVVYDAAGWVIFHGGITRARGRGGDNPGRRALAAVLAGSEPETCQTPVFGCPLLDAEKCDIPTGRSGDSECRQ